MNNYSTETLYTLKKKMVFYYKIKVSHLKVSKGMVDKNDSHLKRTRLFELAMSLLIVISNNINNTYFMILSQSE